MKTIKKFGENIRHVFQVEYNNIKHELRLISEDRYEAAEALETWIHVSNMARIDHPDNQLVERFNQGVKTVGDIMEIGFDHLDI